MYEQASGAALRRSRRHGLQRARARPPRSAAGAARAPDLAVHRRRASRRAGPCSASRGSSPRSSSASGPGAAACARPPTRACARTSPRDEVVREDTFGGLAARRRRRGHTGRRSFAVPAEAARTARVTVEGRELKLSNLDKVLYPQTRLHQARADRLLRARSRRCCSAHLAGRALTVTRWPDGVRRASPSFRSRRPRIAPEWVRTVTLPSERKPIDYTLVDDLPTLVWLANLAAIELHTPLARAEAIDAPDDARVRPRPGRAGDDRRVLPRRPAAAGHVREPRPAELRQDIGVQGAAAVRPAELHGRHLRADQAVRQSGRRAARAAPNRT